MKLPAIRKASKSDEFHRNITPGFILERKMVNYAHLPRSCTRSHPDGSLADRIGWVITHPDLHAQVLRRTRDIPNAAYNIRLYRHLTETAPCLARLATHTRRAGAPKPEKLAAQAAADSAYQHLITAAESVIEVLTTGRMAGALKDLLPLRTQHLYPGDTGLVKEPLQTPARISKAPSEWHDGPSNSFLYNDGWREPLPVTPLDDVPLTTSHTSSQGANAGTAEGSTLEELTTSLQAFTIAFDGKEKPLLFWFTFKSKNPFNILREKTPSRESSPEEGEGYVKRL